MLKLFATCVLLGVVQVNCQSSFPPTQPIHTTQHHHHRTTRESNEHGVMFFVYDHHSGAMLMETHSTCYVMDLTDNEKAQVHDPDKLEHVELKLSKLAFDPKTHSSLDLSNAPSTFKARCHKRTFVKITEPITAN